jgi:integrase/recombinase XerD
MPKRLPVSLRGDEPDRLLAAVRCPRDRIVYLCGLYLGLRISEIVCRRVEDVDLQQSLYMVRHGKCDKDRSVPVPARLLPELRAWVGDRKEGWLFPSRGKTGQVTARGVQMAIAKAAKRAGIPRHVTPHKLRHTYATRLLQRGATIMEVRDLLGHASVATTQIYLECEPERLRAAVDRL